MRTRTRVVLSVGVVIASVAHAAVAQEVQWLKYRRADDDTGPVIAREKPLELSSTRPQGVRMPEFEGDTQLFGRWYAPLAPDGYLWLALDRSGTSGLYDRLYIDSNGNGHLNDESVAFGVGMNVRSAHFGPLCVVFLTEHGLIAYHLRFIFFGQEEINTLSAYSSGWREGTIAIGNKQTRCTLIDYNVNGVFNDKPRNLRHPDPSGEFCGSRDCDMIPFMVGK